MSFSNTAWIVHIVLQIFREVKGKGLYVGGNTDLYARKTKGSPAFFKVKMGDSRYLWGIESYMMGAIRSATENVNLDIFNKRLKVLIQKLRKLRKLCKEQQQWWGGDVLDMTEHGHGMDWQRSENLWE